MRSYRRLEVLALFFSCNKLLISSSLSRSDIFEDLSKKTFSWLSSAVPVSHLFPLFRENISENTASTFLKQFSGHISPESQLSKGINLCRHLHMGRFFHLWISCRRSISQIVNSKLGQNSVTLHFQCWTFVSLSLCIHQFRHHVKTKKVKNVHLRFSSL